MSGRRPARLKTYGRQTHTRLNVPWSVFVKTNDKFEELISNCTRYEHPDRDDEPISSGLNTSSSSDSCGLASYPNDIEIDSPPKERKKTIRRADDNRANARHLATPLNSSPIDFETPSDKKKKATKSKNQGGRRKRNVNADFQQGNNAQNTRKASERSEPPGKRVLRERNKIVNRPQTNSDSTIEFEKLLGLDECHRKRKKTKILKENHAKENVVSKITRRNKEKVAIPLTQVGRNNIENVLKKSEDVTRRKAPSYSSSVEFEKPSVKPICEIRKERQDFQRALQSLVETIVIDSTVSADTDQLPRHNNTPGQLSGNVHKLPAEILCQNASLVCREPSKALKSTSDNSVTQSRVCHINSSVKIDRVLTKNRLSDFCINKCTHFSSGECSKRPSLNRAASTPINGVILPGHHKPFHFQPNNSRRFMAGDGFIMASGVMPSPIFREDSPMKPFLPASNRRSSSTNKRSLPRECKLNEISGLSIFDLSSIAENSPQDENLKVVVNDDDLVKNVPKIVNIGKHLHRTTILTSADGTQLSRDKCADANLSLVFAGLAPLNTSGKRPETTSEILRLCGQETILDFQEAFPKRLSRLTTSKVGEGAYSEVYKVMMDGTKVVVKIIPVGGVTPKTEEKQMTFEDVLSEMAITQTLSELRENQVNCCSSFIHVMEMQFVKGRYPLPLLAAWRRYASDWPTANEYPGVFLEDQSYVVLKFEDGGSDLEHFTISDPVEALSIFLQVSCALAVAEKELAFEHRDLHCGNILVSKTKCETVPYLIDGVAVNIKTSGVLVKIIDYTLSRMYQNNVNIYTDLADHEELFNGKGDPQYDVYREMRKVNKNNWAEFCPLTNVLWVNHILEKMTIWTKSKSRNKARVSAYDELCRKATVLKSYSSLHEFVISTGSS